MNKTGIIKVLWIIKFMLSRWIIAGLDATMTGSSINNILKMNISDPYIDLQTDTELFLKCSGLSNTKWGYIDPTVPENEKEISEIKANYTVTENNSLRESIIHLKFDYEEQTGTYVCYQQHYKASVYIFVDGGKDLLLPIYDMYIPFIQLYHGRPDVVPCLPTFSKVNVTLWKIRGSSKEMVAVQFDPTRGFLIPNPTEYFQKSFVCIAEYEERITRMHLDLETIRETESIPQVYINNNDARYVLLGSNFSLECIVQTEINTMVTVSWTYPGNYSRVTEKDLPVMKSKAHQNVTKFLYVWNATKAEEGTYQCNSSDHSGKQNYAQVHVKVFDSPQAPKVYFNSEVESIIKRRGETVQLIAPFVVFPFSSDIRIQWTKSKQPITSDLKKYQSNSDESSFVLEISYLSAVDSGIYTVTANATGGFSEKIFHLFVEDKPVVYLEETRHCCYTPEQNYTLSCDVIAYPQPRITWKWRRFCSEEAFNCAPEFLIETSEIILIEEHTISQVTLNKQESGYITCKSQNEYGTAEVQSLFVVSDIPNGFAVNSDNTFPFEDSNFIATCEASLVLYSSLSWVWIPDSVNETIIASVENRVYSNNSETIALDLRIEEIKRKHSGTYICRAYIRNETGFEEKSIKLDVQIGAAELLERNKSKSQWIVYTTAISGATFCFLLMVIWGMRRNSNKKHRLLHLQKFTRHSFQDGRLALLDPNLPLDDQVDLLVYDEKWEFPREKLKLGKTLGQGAFGRVVQAEAYGITEEHKSTVVAVKMLKEDSDSHQQKALMDELKILTHLGHHENIVNLMGAVTKNIPRGELMIIVEFCRYGNIRDYLYRHRNCFVDENEIEAGINVEPGDFVTQASSSDLINSTSSSGTLAVENPSYSSVPTSVRDSILPKVITTSDLLRYALQCAQGMDYLSSKKLIHRDLAARNILLADKDTVKICDFGLAKNCYEYPGYVRKGNGPLPIKWMSIESIWDHVFTTKSDVWSYGVLLWELFTLGGNPYPGIDIDEDFYKKVKAGYRMEKPQFCPKPVYEIMRNCWKADPDQRPTFGQIAKMLDENNIESAASYMEMKQSLSTPDYTNVGRKEKQRFYINSMNVDILSYDVPPHRHSLIDNATSIEPAKLVPMLELESQKQNSDEFSEISRETTTNTSNSKIKTDYLQMKK